jgi:hypothetical protein
MAIKIVENGFDELLNDICAPQVLVTLMPGTDRRSAPSVLSQQSDADAVTENCAAHLSYDQ